MAVEFESLRTARVWEGVEECLGEDFILPPMAAWEEEEVMIWWLGDGWPGGKMKKKKARKKLIPHC